METTGNTGQIMNITFTDVMQIIASNDTKPTEKMVYIYLLNVIMDLDEKITILQNQMNEYVNIDEDVD